VKRLEDSEYKNLYWIQQYLLSRNYQLRTKADVFATIRTSGASVWAEGTNMKCHIRDNRPSFSRPPDVKIHGYSEQIARIELDSSYRGFIEFFGHDVFEFTGHSWRDDSGDFLVHYVTGTKIRFRGDVEITQKAIPQRHLMLLLCLGWYFTFRSVDYSA
jgi:hypothetical protein